MVLELCTLDRLKIITFWWSVISLVIFFSFYKRCLFFFLDTKNPLGLENVLFKVYTILIINRCAFDSIIIYLQLEFLEKFGYKARMSTKTEVSRNSWRESKDDWVISNKYPKLNRFWPTLSTKGWKDHYLWIFIKLITNKFVLWINNSIWKYFVKRNIGIRSLIFYICCFHHKYLSIIVQQWMKIPELNSC